MEVIYHEKKNTGSIYCCRVIIMWMWWKNNDNNTNKDIDNNVDNNINYVVGDYDFSYNEKTDSPVGYEWGDMSESHDGYYVPILGNIKFWIVSLKIVFRFAVIPIVPIILKNVYHIFIGMIYH